MDSLYPEKCRACDCSDMTMNTNSPQPLILHTFDTGKTVLGMIFCNLLCSNLVKPPYTHGMEIGCFDETQQSTIPYVCQ